MTFLYLLILLSISSSLLSQTILKPVPLSSWHIGSDSINFNDTSVFSPRKQSVYVLGWQWAGPSAATNSRLRINFFHSSFGYTGTRWGTWDDSHTHRLNPPLLPTIPDSGNIHYLCWKGIGSDDMLQCDERGMSFDPTADTAFNPSSPVRVHDTTGAINGFRFRNPSGTLNAYPDENFDRYVLDTSIGGTASSGVTVLSNPIVDDVYSIFPDRDTVILEHLSGKRWVLSINLRRCLTSDSTDNKDTILSVQIIGIKGTHLQDTLYLDSVAFDSLNTHSYSLPFNRGVALASRKADSLQKTFFITRNMIPRGNVTSTNRDITMSIAFSFKSRSGTSQLNQYLIGGRASDINDIEKVSYVVKYHGKGVVGIDWCRIVTPDCQKLLQGYKDSSAWRKVHLVIDTVKNSYISSLHKNVRLHSFYGQDEPTQDYYLSQRYYRYLLDGRFTTEGGSDEIGRATMELLHPWHGAGVKNSYSLCPTPYLNYGTDTSKYNFGIKSGLWNTCTPGFGSRPMLADGSNYDTDLMIGSGKFIKIKHEDSADTLYFRNYDVKLYEANPDPIDFLGGVHAVESGIRYFCHSPFTYDTIPFWVNIWGTSPFQITYFTSETQRRINTHKRFMTGEEMRVQMWVPLIMGAKGFLYDRMYSDSLLLVNYSFIQYYDTTVVHCDTCYQNIGIGHGRFQGMMLNPEQIPTGLTGTSLIESDSAGSDFLANGDRSHIDKFITLDSAAFRRGVAPGRVYVGRKSMRREIMKMHDYIHDNESLIMSMKLAASFHKGLYTVITGDTANLTRIVSPYAILYPDSNKRRFSERPPGRVLMDTASGAFLPYYEDYDSTFFDVTLHKIGTLPLDSEFVLCVLNRRTNPVIRDHDTLRFISTAEFDSMANHSAIGRYSQGGSREINVPFHFVKDTGEHVGKYVLHVKELSGGDSTLTRVNTFLCPTCDLSATYLPGEAKLFHVTVIPTGRVVSNGALEFMNQHKLICAPKYLTLNAINHKPLYDSSQARYHLVCYRNDSLPGGPRARVHYMRTGLIDRCTPFDVIDPLRLTMSDVWEQDMVLSDTIVRGADTLLSTPCKFPSLVVRFDTVARKEYVYVVFDCQRDVAIDSTTPPFIAESQFEMLETRAHSRWLDSVNTNGTYELYGHPVVNASKNANYYCFSDYRRGIVIAARRPDTASRSSFSFNHLSWFGSISNTFSSDSADARHPSLNTYSNLASDTTCALVWQERRRYTGPVPYDSAYDAWQIYYTHLNYDGSFASFELPSYDVLSVQGWAFRTGDSSIVRPRYCGFSGCNGDWRDRQIPSVFRHFSVTADSFNFDKIVTHAARTPFCGSSNPTTGMLYFSVLTRKACNTCVAKLFPTGNNATYSCEDSIRFVGGTVAQNVDVEHGDSTFIFSLEFPGNDNILQVTQSFFHFGGPADAFIAASESAQLSAQPFLNGRYHWNFTRRVANKPDLFVNRLINNSVQYLMKETEATGLQTYVLKGFRTDRRSFVLHDIIDDESRATLHESEPGNVEDNPGDTLLSKWFRVGHDKMLRFVYGGDAFDACEFRIQNRRTRISTTINKADFFVLSNSGVQTCNMLLANGNDDEYRMQLAPTDSNDVYNEEMYVGNVNPWLAKRANNDNTSVIDLSSTQSCNTSSMISLYPNPVLDEVFISIGHQSRLSEVTGAELTIQMSNVVGEVVWSGKSFGGETIKVSIAGVPSGMYNVRVIGSAHDALESGQVSSARLVVSR